MNRLQTPAMGEPPHVLTTSDLMRTAAAALSQAMPPLSEELRVRALRIDQLRDEAERDRRRGFALPLGYLTRIDGAPDPVAKEAFDAWAHGRSQ